MHCLALQSALVTLGSIINLWYRLSPNEWFKNRKRVAWHIFNPRQRLERILRDVKQVPDPLKEPQTEEKMLVRWQIPTTWPSELPLDWTLTDYKIQSGPLSNRLCRTVFISSWKWLASPFKDRDVINPWPPFAIGSSWIQLDRSADSIIEDQQQINWLRYVLTFNPAQSSPIQSTNPAKKKTKKTTQSNWTLQLKGHWSWLVDFKSKTISRLIDLITFWRPIQPNPAQSSKNDTIKLGPRIWRAKTAAIAPLEPIVGLKIEDQQQINWLDYILTSNPAQSERS